MNLLKRVRVAVVIAGALTLVSCGPREQAKQEPSAPAPEQHSFSWTAVAPSSVADPGPPARLHLADGYAAAVFAGTAVNPGDAVTARYTLQGAAGQYVRVILQRHCSTENGDDNVAHDVLLNGQPQQDEIALTFGAHYDCIRLSFVSNGHQNLDMTVDDLTITKTP